MYTVKNYRTKKALKEDVAAGVPVDTFQPGGLLSPQAQRQGVPRGTTLPGAAPVVRPGYLERRPGGHGQIAIGETGREPRPVGNSWPTADEPS